MNEKIGLQENVSIEKQSGLLEKIGPWKTSWLIEKFREGEKTPYAVEKFEGNIAVNAGLQLLEDLLIGAGGTAYNNANSYIGVGDSTTAADAAQTDLQAATNKTRKAMESTFPSRSGQTLSFKSVFGTGDANYAWEEFGIFNASTAGTMLNRKVSSKGTKTSSDTWTITLQITIS